MPTISIRGITFDASPETVAIVQPWTGQLENAAQIILDAAPNFDPRLQPVLTPTGLAPLFRGLTALLAETVRLLATAAPPATPTTSTTSTPPASTVPAAPSAPVVSAVQDILSRYLDGFFEALNRLLRDWDKLGPIFFTQGEGSAAVSCQVVSLSGVNPLPGALGQGGRASLLLSLTIANLSASAAGNLQARLVYLPRDVEADCTLVGNTAHLCSAGPGYVACSTECSHPSCRSVAERINATLGDPTAIPTCIVWPAAPASSTDLAAPANGYGYREWLSSDQPGDNTVASPQAPEVATFYRTLGRELALAYAFGAQDVATSDFVVHQLRPYWIGLACAFATPNQDLRATGLFDPPQGPLAPPVRTVPGNSPPSAPKFGLVAASPATRAAPVPISAFASVAEVRRGCAETLEALATLGPELGARFENGRNLLSQFHPRDPSETRERQRRWLELLSIASSWDDWQALDRETAQWRNTDDAVWTRHWFGGLLAQSQSTFPLWVQFPPEMTEALNPLRDEVTGPLGVRAFPDVRIENILALAPAEREPVWNALVGLAQLLCGFWRQTDWIPWLETAWDPLPLSALVEFEVADHARARMPYFFRRLQSASVWSAGNGQEAPLSGFTDAPPPRLARNTFFPEPMSVATTRQLQLLANPGMRASLVSSIPRLMEASPAPQPSVRPVGPPLTATSSTAA